jgi:YbbR domain-containing protein
MLTRLRENFTYKMFALICAIGLHFIAASEQNPQQTRQLMVRPIARGVSANALVDSSSVPAITVTVTGPPDDVNRLTKDDITAAIDLTGSVMGATQPLPIKVEIAAPSREQIDIVEYTPRTISVTLKPRKKRRLPIAVDYPRTLPAGYTYQVPSLIPRQATISGAEDSVDLVAQLMVQVDSDTGTGPIDDDFTIRALDAHGNVVSDVAVIPLTAHVQIGIVKVPAMKALLVSPRIVGAPPFAFTVATVDVVPPTVTVAGEPEVLARTGTIATEPINIDGLTADQTRQAACIPPTGLNSPTPQKVTVRIHITPRNTGAPPPAAPATTVTIPTEPPLTQ